MLKGPLVIDYQCCVIDYTEEQATGNQLPVMCNRLHSAFYRFHVLKLCNSSLVSGNRLPRLCNRLLEMKSLEIPLLLACSGYGTHCVAAVVRSLVKKSTPFFYFL